MVALNSNDWRLRRRGKVAKNGRQKNSVLESIFVALECQEMDATWTVTSIWATKNFRVGAGSNQFFHSVIAVHYLPPRERMGRLLNLEFSLLIGNNGKCFFVSTMFSHLSMWVRKNVRSQSFLRCLQALLCIGGTWPCDLFQHQDKSARLSEKGRRSSKIPFSCIQMDRCGRTSLLFTVGTR